MNMKTIFITGLCSIILVNPVLGYTVIVEEVPSFEFDSVNTINGTEGGTTQITVTGTAKGSGSIDLSVSSGAVKGVSWDGGSMKNIEKGKDYTFTGTLNFNVGLDADKYFDATVYSSPVGSFGVTTSKSFQIYLTDKDVPKNNTPFLNPFIIFSILIVVTIILNRQKKKPKKK